MLFFSFLASSLALLIPSLFASPIIGGWVHNDGLANDSDALVFLEDGSYFHIEDGEPATMQRGTYQWDETSGQLTLTPIVEVGSNDGQQSFPFPIDGDSAASGEFHRVTSVDNPLVGAWSFGDTAQSDSGVLVFLQNGVFFFGQDLSDPDPPHNQSGMERGTYIYDQESLEFTATTTIDTNGDIGLSDPDGDVTVSVFGDLMAYKNGALRFGLERVTATPKTADAIAATQEIEITQDGQLGIRMQSREGFFYRIEKKRDLLSDFVPLTEVVSGDGELTSLLAVEPLAAFPKGFFTTKVEVMRIPRFEELRQILAGVTIEGVTFSSLATWASGTDNGRWEYLIRNAASSELIYASGEDVFLANTYTSLSFDFSAAASLAEVPTTIRRFENFAEVDSRDSVLNLSATQGVEQIQPSEAEFTTLVSGKTLKGVNFTSDGRWTAFGEEGTWVYFTSERSQGVLRLVVVDSGVSSGIARDSLHFFFPARQNATGSTGLENVATIYEVDREDSDRQSRNLLLDLSANSFAPLRETFVRTMHQRSITTAAGTTVFNENGRFNFNNGETGDWSVSEVDKDRLLLVQTYDEDGNNPGVYREELLLTFDGTTQVAVNYREYDGGSLDFETNATITLD